MWIRNSHSFQNFFLLQSDVLERMVDPHGDVIGTCPPVALPLDGGEQPSLYSVGKKTHIRTFPPSSQKRKMPTKYLEEYYYSYTIYSRKQIHNILQSHSFIFILNGYFLDRKKIKIKNKNYQIYTIDTHYKIFTLFYRSPLYKC